MGSNWRTWDGRRASDDDADRLVESALETMRRGEDIGLTRTGDTLVLVVEMDGRLEVYDCMVRREKTLSLSAVGRRRRKREAGNG